MTQKEVIKILLEQKILIDYSEEDKFAKENNLHIRKFKDGMVHFGMNKPDNEEARLSTNIRFWSGALSDPVEKEGIHHLLEHLLVSEEWRKTTSMFFGSYDAWTSAYIVGFNTAGFFSEKKIEFSFPQIFDELISSLDSGGYIRDEKKIEVEKEVVIKEIKQREADFFLQCKKKLAGFVLGEKNAERIEIMGDLDSLSSIKSDDLVEVFKNSIGTSNIVASSYLNGNKEVYANAIELIERKLSMIKNGGKN